MKERGRKQEWEERSSCHACLKLGNSVECSGQGLLVESLVLDRNSYPFTLPQFSVVGHGPSQGKAWPWTRQLSEVEVFSEGADRWKLSDDHTPCSWATRPPWRRIRRRQNWSSVLPRDSWLLKASWLAPICLPSLASEELQAELQRSWWSFSTWSLFPPILFQTLILSLSLL